MINVSTDISITDLINTGLGLITAGCATYLAYAALKHSARPNAKVFMMEPKQLYSGATVLFKFAFQNAGHWYAKPMVVRMTAYINFDRDFEPLSMQSGSTQAVESHDVRIGKGKMKYLKVQGIMLSYGEDSEEVHVTATNPSVPGRYRIKISAYSENGLNLTKHFDVDVLKALGESTTE